MRVKASAAFCLTLLFAALCALPGDAARAQGSRRRGTQPAPPAAAAQQPERPKQVIIGRGSDNQRGSRMTITSDEALNDYSAYRSGDRFYVELPNANAATAARAAGRGFTDLQVQRRGKNVVLSYRVQPGAKPRVEQRFNRLEVIFEVPQGEAAAQAPAQPQPTAAASPAASQPARGETATQPAPGQSTPAAGRPAPTPAPQTGASQTPLTNPATAVVAGQPPPSAQPSVEPASTPVEQAATPAPQTAPQELAQAQPPAPFAPATTNNAAAQQGSGTSIGAFLMRNWVVVLVAVLLLAGIGLLVASRRTATTAPPPPAALKDSPAAKLDEAKTTTRAAAVAAPVAAAAAALKESKKEARKSKKAREARAAREEAKTPSVVAPVAEAPAEPAAETATAEAAPSVAAPPAVETVVEESAAVEAAAEETAAAEAVTTTETVVDEATVAAPLVAAPEVAETAEAEKGIEAAAPVAAMPEAEPSKGLEPFVALDPDRAHTETRLLLEGAEYDRGILSTRDAMARQMIASELLSALAGRNAERRERALAAFSEYGYFEEKVEDLRTAQAAAERSSAARALGLAGDRKATPYLVEALEDDAVEVRRAAVESLASLRDPAAVAPLEALLRREKKSKTKVNRKLVEHAVQTCREGAAEAPAAAATTPAVETAAGVAGVAEVAPAVEAFEESRAPEASEEVSAAQPEMSGATLTEETLVSEERGLEPVGAHEPSLFVAEPPAEPAPATAEVSAADEVAVAEPAVGEAAAEETVETVAAEPTAPAHLPSWFEATPTVAEEPASVEEPAAVEEHAAVEETAAIEPFAAAEETTAPASLFDAAGTFESTTPAAVEYAPPSVEESAGVEETAAPAFEEPVAEEPTVAEEVSARQPAAGAEAVAEAGTVEAPSEAAWEQPAASPYVTTPTQASEPSALFEEEAAATTPVEEPSAFGFERAAVAEEEVEAGREERAEEWVELDLSGLGTSPAATEAPVFESSAGEAVTPAESSTTETHAPVAEASRATMLDEVAVEPVGAADEPAEALPLTLPRAAEQRPMAGLFESGAATETVATDEEKGVAPFDEFSAVPANLQQRLASREPSERAAAVAELARVDTGEAFHQICAAFDDEARDVRSAAARALYDVQGDRADSFTRALREAGAERRRNIGAAIASSGLASDAISQLTGESREKTYEAFSLLFLMAKAGEVAPLVRAIEGHPNNEVRLAVVKLLALSGQKEILPAFRRLAVRGSLPTEVRSAVMEAIYQISSQSETTPAA